jgi:hypothetical protein
VSLCAHVRDAQARHWQSVSSSVRAWASHTAASSWQVLKTRAVPMRT